MIACRICAEPLLLHHGHQIVPGHPKIADFICVDCWEWSFHIILKPGPGGKWAPWVPRDPDITAGG